MCSQIIKLNYISKSSEVAIISRSRKIFSHWATEPAMPTSLAYTVAAWCHLQVVEAAKKKPPNLRYTKEESLWRLWTVGHRHQFFTQTMLYLFLLLNMYWCFIHNYNRFFSIWDAWFSTFGGHLFNCLVLMALFSITMKFINDLNFMIVWFLII